MFGLVGSLQAQKLEKSFKVGVDLYNFDYQMETLVIKPKDLVNKIQLEISYLPEAKNLKNLPVIYLTDGQWRRMDHKYIHYLTYKKIIPPVIVVGVGYTEEANVGQARWVDMVMKPEALIKVFKTEIIPLVESKYRINAAERYLFGASNGGYFVTYACMKSCLEVDRTFAGFIGSSPYLATEDGVVDAQKMAQELVAKQRKFQTKLYLAYGQKEGIWEYQQPNNELFQTLEHQILKGLNFIHHVYPDSDHFSNTRLTLIDGLRLFLGKKVNQAVGAVDLKYQSYQYQFKHNTEFYDWNTNFVAANSYCTDQKYSLDKKSGSFEVKADFSKYNSLNFQTSSVYFEGLADRKVEFNIYIPQDLAKLKYSVRLMIYSTHPGQMEWQADYSESFPIIKAGWNTFQCKWRGQKVTGNLDCIRGFGITIDKSQAAVAWQGKLYFDNIGW